MDLLHATSFASSVLSSKDPLKRISIIISKYCGKAEGNGFLTACDNLDFAKANKILEHTVEMLTGYADVFMALSIFVEKFPDLNPELSNKVSAVRSEAKKVKAIDGYYDKIVNIIERNLRKQ